MPVKRTMPTQKKKSVTKLVKRVLSSQAEKKSFTYRVFNGTANSTSWTLKSFLGDTINGIGQGVSNADRIGDRIRLVAIHFCVRIIPTAVMPEANGNFCRVIVYHNNSARGVLPNATDIFNSDEVISLRNHNFRNRLSVLKDFTHQMVVTSTNGATNVTSGPEFFGTFTIYPKQIISYTGSDGYISDLSKQDYGIGFCGDAASCCNVTVWSQVVYTDV